ncbi:MAG: hypothetical protein KDD43_10535, partial [Bdellovibrionales bacterium]|nr:hypothetical protein [Bdellovibrionales bacterium]
ATFGGSAPENLYQDIRKLEQAQFNSAVITSYDEKYQGFLILGLIFAFLNLLIGERKRSARLWRGRFEVAQE